MFVRFRRTPPKRVNPFSLMLTPLPCDGCVALGELAKLLFRVIYPGRVRRTHWAGNCLCCPGLSGFLGRELVWTVIVDASDYWSVLALGGGQMLARMLK